MSEPLDHELRARGEDPRAFCRLHRDLVAIFHPHDQPTSAAVVMLAYAWWQKARRIRQWVGAGRPQCTEIESRIEGLLVLVISQMRDAHRHWRRRLADVVGDTIGSPSEVRGQIEAQLQLFGAKPRRYRPEPEPEPMDAPPAAAASAAPAAGPPAGVAGSKETLEAYLERELREIIAKAARKRQPPNSAQSHLN